MKRGEKFLRDLFNQMEKRYRFEREMFRRQLEEKYKAPVIFVHELLQCPLKQELAEKFPEIEMASMYNPRFVVGWLIEEAVKKLTDSGEKTFHKVVDTDGGRFVLAGTADIVLEGDTVVEVKYLSGMYGTPHEHHILQLQLYLFLGDFESGELWMFSPEGVVAEEVKPIEQARVRELVEAYLSRRDAPRWEWECERCIYEEWCARSLRKVRRK